MKSAFEKKYCLSVGIEALYTTKKYKWSLQGNFMKTKWLLLPILAFAFSACDQMNTKSSDSKVKDVDNTGINVRDRDSNLPTADNQNENEADRTITQKIREGIVKDDALSTYAKNIKIITRNGEVTLRGPVKTDLEKSRILNIARQVGGVNRVDNQLEVTSK